MPGGDAKLGGIDRTKDYLLKNGFSVALLEHPLTTVDVDYEQPKRSCLSILQGTERSVLCRFNIRPCGNPWRWIGEKLVSEKVVAKQLNPGFVAFAADPLSGLTSLGLRRMGLATKAVLHFTDYSPNRFGNPLLNFLYQRICVKNLAESDLVLCVSRRMQEHFKRWYPLSTYMFFPNTPEVSECPFCPVKERNRHDIVLLGVAGEGMRHDLLFAGLSKAARKYPRLKLHVIGGGGGEQILESKAEKLGIKESVIIHNFMPRPEALKVVAKSGIGVVLYDKAVPWNYYRDSLKIREYGACGLPVICDSSTGTAEEAREAEAAILVEAETELVDAFDRLLSDDGLYEKMSHAAREWAKKNDKRMYLEKMMDFLEESS